jgi:hypothetical protein
VCSFLIYVWRRFLFAYTCIKLFSSSKKRTGVIFQCGGDAWECACKCLLMYTKYALSRRRDESLYFVMDIYVYAVCEACSAIFLLLPGRRESTPRALYARELNVIVHSGAACGNFSKTRKRRSHFIIMCERHAKTLTALLLYHLFPSNQSTESKRTFFWQCTFLAAQHFLNLFRAFSERARPTSWCIALSPRTH